MLVESQLSRYSVRDAECPLSGGKADIIQRKADIKKCPLMTQSGNISMIYLPAKANSTGPGSPYCIYTGTTGDVPGRVRN